MHLLSLSFQQHSSLASLDVLLNYSHHMGAGSFFILRSENVSLVFSEFVCVLIIQSFLSSTVIIISLESSPHQITHQVIIIPLELSSHQITHHSSSHHHPIFWISQENLSGITMCKYACHISKLNRIVVNPFSLCSHFGNNREDAA